MNEAENDSLAVRISGWLMLDPEHPDQLGKTRGTIWEIHPVMKLKVLPEKYSPQDYRGIEVIGLYWHFVDLVWIILFTIVYLI